MKDRRYKKSLALGIFILFIGAGVVPSISGYIGKTSNKSIIEAPTGFPLNNDYTHAYWKFDEGNGNTAHDSSAHNFDGTIYGATWTTDTPSGSGYALDFDGANDYVDLNAHSEDLGFNKTDDLIFSFYIKSTSTDKSIIYGMDRYDYNPGVHIALNSNGTIEFKAWVLSCGFILTSNGTYNNGDWHYVEIWYNGISANPTVTIYVDNEPDTIMTHWVCTFYNDQFERTKIGRRSNDSTNYFDGVIDELKVIKYPGGNQQNPPIITGPTHGEPGVEYDFTFVTNDPEGDDIWLWIDWNDGNIEDWFGPFESGEEVTVSHTWNENGKYRIRAKSMDIWDDSYSSHHEIIIGNQPPNPPEINGPQFGDPGVEYTYTFESSDPEKDDVCYFIDWDDGTTNETDYYESGVEVTVPHTWDSTGDYEIKAKAKDTYGNEGDWSTYSVRIGDQPPYAPDIDGPTSGIPGVEYIYTFVTTDPEGDDVKYHIKWGDGKEEWTTLHASGEEVTVGHTWTEVGTYTITAKAQDKYGLDGPEGTLVVTIPKNKAFNFNFNLLSWLFERFPNAFPILRYILGL